MPKTVKQKILIADDEKPLAKALSLKLERSGFEVDIVHNGKDALTKLKKTKYDILLLDLIMPEVDGFGVLEELKKGKEIPTVCILSNLGQREDIERTKDFPISFYLVKSNTTLSEIVNLINEKFGNA